VFISFSLGLMAKPMLVTLPFVLLLLDYWPLRRFPYKPLEANGYSRQGCTGNAQVPLRDASVSRLILEKIPFIMLAVFSSIITIFAQRSGEAMATLERFSFTERVANAFISYSLYIQKMFWPTELLVFYPHPGTWPFWQIFVAVLLFLGISSLVWKERYCSYLSVGWLWYLGTLIPVIGIVQVGSQAMADRYTYIPLIGLFIMIAWGASDVLQKYSHKRFIISVSAALILVLLMICTWIQIKHWENGISLFQNAANSVGNNGIILNNLGNALARKGRIEEAIIQYKKAIDVKPNNSEIYNNLGKVLTLQGKENEAIIQYKKAIMLQPRHLKAHFNIGVSYFNLGNYQEAIYYYSEALKIKPDFVAAYNNLGIVYTRMGDIDQAILYFQKALLIFPNYDSAKNNLRIAMEEKGALSPAPSGR
jgi:Flp pilus assembly protein TadD